MELAFYPNVRKYDMCKKKKNKMFCCSLGPRKNTNLTGKCRNSNLNSMYRNSWKPSVCNSALCTIRGKRVKAAIHLHFCLVKLGSFQTCWTYIAHSICQSTVQPSAALVQPQCSPVQPCVQCALSQVAFFSDPELIRSSNSPKKWTK